MKYLELIKGQFTADHEARAKQEEPYVAYSEEAGGVMYNFIPALVVGPADNEIWYTSSDGNVVTLNENTSWGASIISNEYNDGKGVITFDKDVTSIGDGAINECSSLTSITLPNSVTSIGRWAFMGCPFLTSITIPEGVTSIGENAFAFCQSLTPITLPNSVTSIGGWAFSDCSSLTSIIFDGTIEEWNTVSKGSDWNSGVPATYVQCTDGQVTL